MKERHVAPPEPVAPVAPVISEWRVVAAEPAPVPPTKASEPPTAAYANEHPRSSARAPLLIAGVFVIMMLLVVALFVGTHFGEVSERSRQERKALEDNERIKSLRKEREIVRLSNQVDDAREWAKLRELRIEAAKAGLQGKAGERWMDWVVTKQALDQLLSGGPREEAAPPLAMAERHLLEEIESRKADGKDSNELELALQRLRQARVS